MTARARAVSRSNRTSDVTKTILGVTSPLPVNVTTFSLQELLKTRKSDSSKVQQGEQKSGTPAE